MPGTFFWLRTITAFDGPELTVEAMELDDAGFPRTTGRLETLTGGTLILALGQDADTAFLRAVPGVEFTPDGTVVVSPPMMTGSPGLFAGGDMVPSERTVTVGAGHGKKAARFIGAYLRGTRAAGPAKYDLAGFGLLHPWYFAGAAPRSAPERAAAERVADFAEVTGGLTAAQAGYEGAPVPVLRQLLRMRRLPGRVPRGRGDQAGARAPLPVRLRPLRRLRNLRRPVPGARHRDEPGGAVMRVTADGDEAAASAAYRLNEVCCTYPVTPSSPMADLADERASAGRPNVWGSVPTVVEMQSEGGAAGALHGALQSGALTTTFLSPVDVSRATRGGVALLTVSRWRFTTALRRERPGRPAGRCSPTRCRTSRTP
jgi:hypothetical protein